MKKILCLVLLAALTCCAKPPPPPPVLTLNIAGSANQNPDPSGQGTAVALYLYQLTATGKFQSTDVYSLMSQEATVLGTDEAGSSEQILVNPGQSLTETRSLKPNVVAVGIAVLFRQINQSTWRLVAPVASNGPSMVTVKISGLTASLGN